MGKVSALRTEAKEYGVQLATRIPAALHRRLRIHCVQTEQSVRAFVEGAIGAELKRQGAAQ